MTLGDLLFGSFCLFLLILFGNLIAARRHRPCNVSGWSRRTTFELWARGYDLDLTRSSTITGQYEYRETWLAWEAFNLGVNTPREIKI